MTSQDRKIWEDSLKDKNNMDVFNVKPGGPYVKPLPRKEISDSTKQKKLEDKVKELEKRIEFLEKELKLVKRLMPRGRK